MWQIVSGQDAETLWKQATGWKNTADLTSRHLFNLQEYRDQMVQAWPPGRSEASSAYMAELDKLIASVQETQDAASANYNAVVSLALAVGDAKYKLKPLFDEYQSNQQKLAAYNQQVDAYNSDTTATPQPSPGPPPIPNGRQEALNNKARSIMYSIGSEITTAGAALKPPAPYKPPTPVRESGGDQSGGNGSAGGGGGGMLVPPVIPPARPASSPPPPSPSAPPAAPPPSTPPGIGQGPILGGTPTPTLAPPPPVTSPPVIQPSPLPGPTPGLPLGPTPPAPSLGLGAPPPAGPPVTGLGNGGGGPGPKGFADMTGRAGLRAMPPGGVIGDRPGAGLARPGAGRPMSRVNPPGGVIGGQAPGGLGKATTGRPVGGASTAARPVGGSGATGGRGVGAAAGRSAQRRHEEESVQHWDPDNPWETAEGVAPVVLPSVEPGRHEPGPAIGHGR
jgi:hypothetical protein